MDKVAEAEIFGPVTENYIQTMSDVEPGHVARMRSINRALEIRSQRR